jgi:tetratricopeptide (TPR) repeat protein
MKYVHIAVRFGLILNLFLASVAIAERDLIKETELENQLAKIDPALVPLFQEARIALDANDNAKAIPLLQRVSTAAPDFDPALRRLGGALMQTGHAEEGFALIQRAMELDPSAPNLFTMACALATRPALPNGNPEIDLRTALGLLRKARAVSPEINQDELILSGQIALKLGDLVEARNVQKELRAHFPDALFTHYLSAFIAANDGKWIEADNEMHKARRLGLDAEMADEFLNSGVHSRAMLWRVIWAFVSMVAAWAMGLLGLAALGFILSKQTLRQIERSDPRVAVAPGEQRLRKIYRRVLNIAGFYYYISLPVIIVLVICVSGGLLFAFFAAGTIPIKLAIIIVIATFITIATMIRSLFVRIDQSDPGRSLDRSEAEGLWNLSEEVARDLGTKPIDEIRITVGTDLCVYERGSWRARNRGDAGRILVVGAGVLNDFKTADFRSVLAHEYGHFAHRDTAGGDVALRVQQDMVKFYLAMCQAGQATIWNLAFQFLRFYQFVFRRISHGATRLQEVLADRVAALHYGPAAFESGLRHVIRRSVDFNLVANHEISKALTERQPISNLYSATPLSEELIAQDYEAAINRPTSLDDTHPGPLERFRLIGSLPEPTQPAPIGTVWDLFEDREKLTTEMMSEIEENVAPHRELS